MNKNKIMRIGGRFPYKRQIQLAQLDESIDKDELPALIIRKSQNAVVISKKEYERLKHLDIYPTAKEVTPNKCVNVLFDCPECDEPISNERFHGEPINYCPNCGTRLKNSINWETKKELRKQQRVAYNKSLEEFKDE